MTTDGIIYYQAFPHSPFGILQEATEGCWDEEQKRCLDTSERIFTNHKVNNMYAVYTVLCIDIDGINQGEDPFGYGIRVDGKVAIGAKATEWLEKSEINGD